MSLNPVLLLAVLLAAIPLSAHSEAEPAPALVLEKSVLLMRHGVRSPNQTPEQLAKSSTRPWPAWPVGPGLLTERGSALLQTLGGWYRLHYADLGLLPADGCPAKGSVVNWSDNAAARIPLSAQALLDGLAPGCGLKAAFAPQTAVDLLFNPVGAGTCPIKAGLAAKAVRKAAGGDLDDAAASIRPVLRRLQEILRVRSLVGCADGASPCGLDGQINILSDGPDGPKLDGGITRAATVSENFLFAYMDGRPDSEIAWGDATTPEALAELSPPRNLFLKLLRKPPYLAARHMTTLGRAVLAELDAAAANPARLVIFMGRDQHVAGMSGLLGIDWTLPGQPDEAPPGATIAFERLRNPANGQTYVRLKLYYQTLVQMRENAVLDREHPPGEVRLPIPGCEAEAIDDACPLPMLRARLEQAFAPECPIRLQ
ncbi:histidine-type phosphatase [Nevskia sp.]|uniref:histidine-type phosphatase n=1 Tax=Nevskia sp. TaxID=1929292 RepID=UPI0025F4C152|nr:histidine-type phosphatase [Nevskia sp.]